MVKKYLIYTGVSVAALAAVMTLVNPATLPSAALFAVFALIYFTIGVVLVSFILILRQLLEVKWKTSTIRRVSFSMALLPTFLLLLQSVGQLTARDAGLALALTLLMYFYSHRMFSAPRDADPLSGK